MMGLVEVLVWIVVAVALLVAAFLLCAVVTTYIQAWLAER